MLNFCYVFCPFRNLIRLLLLLQVRSSQPTGCICSLLAFRRLFLVTLQSLKFAFFIYALDMRFLVMHRTLVTHKRTEWPCPSCVSWELSRLSSHPVFGAKVRDLSPAPDLSLKLMKYNGLNLHQAATLGVPVRGRLMEVGRSIEVCHDLAWTQAEKSLEILFPHYLQVRGKVDNKSGNERWRRAYCKRNDVFNAICSPELYNKIVTVVSAVDSVDEILWRDH